MGVACKVLHVLHGDALAQEVGDDYHAEAVRAEHLRETRVLAATLEETADGPSADAARAETGRGVEVCRAKEGESLGIVDDPGRVDVLGEALVQVEADGDFPLLAALLAETEGTVLAVVAQILEAELGDGGVSLSFLRFFATRVGSGSV